MFITISGKSLALSISVFLIIVFTGGLVLLYTGSAPVTETQEIQEIQEAQEVQPEGTKIKWVDFNVSYEALCDTMSEDIKSYGSENHTSWIDMLAYLACKNGNNFSRYNKSQLTQLTDRLKNGETIESITGDMKYFSYYKESLNAILGGFIGDYAIQTYDEKADEVVWKKRYGLKVFSPIAKNYSFQHYDDFAASRSYGYKRLHTGHDLMGSIGTPIIAVESGTVESAGWNQYGGWRIGIRSFDKKRYYYYAHLRKDRPYASIVKEGEIIKAGDVIGYLGMTGYSTKENVNNINVPHLHFGLQLIFDESQKDGVNQIWVDAYNLVKFLQKNGSEVYHNSETGEFVRRYDFYEPSLRQLR